MASAETAVAVKGAISMIAQASANQSFKKIDLVDVLADSFLRPGYSGAIGGNYDSTFNNPALEVNDSNKKMLVNTATSLLFFKLGGGLKPLINSLPASNTIQAASDLFFFYF